MLIDKRNLIASAVVAVGLAVSAVGPAWAQAMGSQPWNFTQQNRAGIASLIEAQRRAVEAEEAGVAVPSAAVASGSQAVCGGGGTAAATGNYTCIILNDSTAQIDALQDAIGDQAADSNTQIGDITESGSDTNSNSGEAQIDEIAATLQ